MKLDRMPSCLNTPRFKELSLKVQGAIIVQACTHTQSHIGSMYLQDHLLLVVLKGTNTITFGEEKYVVNAGEMILLRKATIINFHKVGDANQEDIYDCLFFFLKDEFLSDFVKAVSLKSDISPDDSRFHITVASAKDRLIKFFDSVKIYFKEPEKNIEENLLRLKIIELLYDIAATDENLLSQILLLKNPIQTSIVNVMEENFANPVSLSELAFLSGRSLSSFRRDFQTIYNTSPSSWIKEKRLNKAKELLLNTSLSVTDVCFMVGFENPSHFSRVYKDFFGCPPSTHAN
ncbi:MAG: AraC family transcriptional regulator [Breznakibacter sp.]